ncbi:MAG: dihydropteroate synthase [Janthinobacterium lividum]
MESTMTAMAFVPRPHFDWHLRSRVMALGERTRLMAIVNLTPDSFSGDGLSTRGLDTAVEAACKAVDGGADILDLGAESTRPGATALCPDEEQARLLPVLEEVCRERPGAVISVDSYHASTAKAAVGMGAEIVNDVSGLQWDGSMAQVVADSGCGLVLMHTRGRPPEWRTLPPLGAEAMLRHVFSGLIEGLMLAEATGIRTESIVLDPGFSFGKIGVENFGLLAHLDQLHQLGRGLLVGLSRKGFLGEVVRPVQAAPMPPVSAVAARRDATVAANVAAILAGAHILRVHDLQAAREAAAVADAVLLAAQ